MKAIDSYNGYVEQILKDQSISDKTKSLYLSMLEITYITDIEERKALEDEFYCIYDKKKLKEKDKINLEINNIYNKIRNLEFNEEILNDYTVDDLIANLSAISFEASTSTSQMKISKLKVYITKMQCQLGINPKFLTVYQDVLKDELLSKEKDVEIKKTFSK